MTAFPSLLTAGEPLWVTAVAGERWTAMDLQGRVWFDGIPAGTSRGLQFNTEGWPAGTVVLIGQESGQSARVVIR